MPSEPSNRALQGKIAALPEDIRERLNRDLSAGKLAPHILPWLNAEPRVAAIVWDQFGGNPISDQNLSNWRHGGFAIWQARRERLNHLEELASHCAAVEAAGGAHIGGAMGLAGGLLMDLLEDVDSGLQKELLQKDPAALVPVMRSLSQIHASHNAGKRLQFDQERLKLAQDRLALDRERFELVACEKILDAIDRPEVRQALAADRPKALKVESLRALIFGPADAPVAPPSADPSQSPAQP